MLRLYHRLLVGDDVTAGHQGEPRGQASGERLHDRYGGGGGRVAGAGRLEGEGLPRWGGSQLELTVEDVGALGHQLSARALDQCLAHWNSYQFGSSWRLDFLHLHLTLGRDELHVGHDCPWLGGGSLLDNDLPSKPSKSSHWQDSRTDRVTARPEDHHVALRLLDEQWLLLSHHDLLVDDGESDGVARVLVEVGGREYRRVAVNLKETFK